MDNDKLPINQIISKINEAAKKEEELNLSASEVKLLSEEFGDQFFIPVLTNE